MHIKDAAYHSVVISCDSDGNQVQSHARFPIVKQIINTRMKRIPTLLRYDPIVLYCLATNKLFK